MDRVVDGLFVLAFGLTALAWTTEPFTTIHLVLGYLRFAIHQLFEGYTLYGFGPGSIIGALALGYVISGLALDGGRPAEATTEAGTNARTEERAGSNVGWPDVEPFGRLRNQYSGDTERHDDRP